MSARIHHPTLRLSSRIQFTTPTPAAQCPVIPSPEPWHFSPAHSPELTVSGTTTPGVEIFIPFPQIAAGHQAPMSSMTKVSTSIQPHWTAAEDSTLPISLGRRPRGAVALMSFLIILFEVGQFSKLFEIMDGSPRSQINIPHTKF